MSVDTEGGADLGARVASVVGDLLPSDETLSDEATQRVRRYLLG